MTGYITTYDGERYRLPTAVEWTIKRTDGDPCDAYSVTFCGEASQAAVLHKAVQFEAEQDGTRIITGVVDDFEMRTNERGFLITVSGRGLAALLMDNQVRSAEYQSAQLQDILNAYVRPYGIKSIDAQSMGPVGAFTVETGYTCWQVLTGFCRHSANIFPRFGADGTLILRKDGTGKRYVIRGGVLRAQYTEQRYGRVAKQILINTRNGSGMTAQDPAFIAIGGSNVHVAGITGHKIRAVWRNAAQRVEDSMRDARILELTLPGIHAAQPLDTVEVVLPETGIAGTFTVSAVQISMGPSGTQTVLEMR